MDKNLIIKADGITRGFPVGGDTFWALKGIGLTVAEGKLTILKGRSGSGKTTLMNILGALDYPTAGDVFFDGTSLKNASEAKRDKIRRRPGGSGL